MDLNSDVGLLVGRCADGDVAAFEALFDLTSTRVHGLVLAIVRDPDLAEEVTQAVFLDVWRGAGRCDGTFSPFSWIISLAHRRAVDHLRGFDSPRRAGQGAGVAWEAPTTGLGSDSVVGDGFGSDVLAVMASMPHDQRALVLAAFFDGCSHRELPAVTGVPLGSVPVGVRTGLRTLTRLLAA